ncbi:MAG: hypothetical protein V5A88_01860 [Candidatus Thermoplasmatota archaeon]
MTETEIDKLRKRLMDTVEEEKDEDRLKEDFKDEFLKDEMFSLLKSADMEPNTNWTKDELAEEMMAEDFMEKVEEEYTPNEEEEEIELKGKKSKVPIMEDLFSPSKMFMNFRTGEYDSMEEFWEDLQESLKGGFDEFKMPPQKYWEEVEEEWKKKVRKLQKNIDELSDTEIPQEDLEELKQMWKDFVKEMNLHMGEIPIELQLRKKNVLEIIKEHSEESKEILSEKERDLKELYPLWFEMIESIKEELEEARDYMEDKEEEIYDEWDMFKDEFTMEVEDIAVEHAENMEDVDEMWSSLSESFEKKLAEGFGEHDHIYKAFWEEMGREKPIMFQKFEEFRENVEKDYSGMVEKALDSIREGYEEMISPVEKGTVKEKEEEIEELKERIEKLEKKLEEE